MADLLPSLTLGLLPRIGQSVAIENGLRGWLSKGNFKLEKPTLDDSGLEITVLDFEELIRHIAFDYERFSLSSQESFAVAYAEKKSKHVAGWPILKLYYSALFSAHAIMRSQGSGVVRLDRSVADYLNSILTISSSTPPTTTSGTYEYKISKDQSGIFQVLTLKPSTSGQGVHDNFWRMFCKFLDESAQRSLLDNAANSTEFLSGSEELIQAIKDNPRNNGVWLSSIRNEINYQHGHKVWFPINKNSIALKALENDSYVSSRSIRIDISKTKHPINSLVSTAKFLACLNNELAEYVAKRSTIGKGFGQKWRRITEHL